MGNNLLVIIDPNNDFVDSRGSLYVPGSEESIDNLCEFIDANSNLFRTILVIQDTHPKVHIGNPNMWHEIEPLTVISSESVISGENKIFSPTENPELEIEIVDYIKAIEKLGGNHIVWPEHCIDGTWGWEIPKRLVKTLTSVNKNETEVVYETKGYGEKLKDTYSLLLHADGTRSGFDISGFASYDEIYICGFAKDICVAYSVWDIMMYPDLHSKLVFLNSCMKSLDDCSENLEIFNKAVKDFGARNYEG